MSITNSRIGNRVTTYQPDLINIFDSSIGDGSVIATFVEIGGADIGRGCDIGAYSKISPKCKIGDATRIGHNTVLMKGVTVGSGVRIGNCCVISSGVVIGDNATIEDSMCINYSVPPGKKVRKEINFNHSPLFKTYENMDPSPAISSDHPARKLWEEPNSPCNLAKKNGEPVQLSFNDFLRVTNECSPSRLHACKGKRMEEPKSEEGDPIGLGILK